MSNPNNTVILTGRLVRDPELYHSPDGKPWTRFTLAVKTGKKSGKKDTADFLSIVLFGKNAENLVQWASKGRLLNVSGQMKSTSYQKDGVTHYRTEVHAETFSLLDFVKKEENQNSASPQNDQASFFQGQSTQFSSDIYQENE